MKPKYWSFFHQFPNHDCLIIVFYLFLVYFWHSWPWFCGRHFLIRTSLKAESEPSLMSQSWGSDLGWLLLTVKEKMMMMIEQMWSQSWFERVTPRSLWTFVWALDTLQTNPQFTTCFPWPWSACPASLWLHHDGYWVASGLKEMRLGEEETCLKNIHTKSVCIGKSQFLTFLINWAWKWRKGV